jgi:hypothetical protein
VVTTPVVVTRVRNYEERSLKRLHIINFSVSESYTFTGKTISLHQIHVFIESSELDNKYLLPFERCTEMEKILRPYLGSVFERIDKTRVNPEDQSIKEITFLM